MRNVLFISYLPLEYSRSAVLLSALSSNTELKVQFRRCSKLNFGNLAQLRRELRRLDPKESLIVVMSPAHQLTLVIRFLFSGVVILDAGWPLSDSSEIRKGRLTVSYLKDSIVDRLSMGLADLVFLESRAQVENLTKRHFYFKNVPRVLFTGFRESRFEQIAHKKANVIRSSKKYEGKIKVLFRGKYNREAGLEFIQSVFSKRGSYELIVCCPDLPPDFIRASNVKFIERFLDDNELANLYSSCDLAIGQFGDSSRVERTIAHKIFEYGYFGIPTICLANSAVKEIFDGKSFIYIEKALLEGYLDKLSESMGEARRLISAKSKWVRTQYSEKCSEIAIARSFIHEIENLQISHISHREV